MIEPEKLDLENQDLGLHLDGDELDDLEASFEAYRKKARQEKGEKEPPTSSVADKS